MLIVGIFNSKTKNFRTLKWKNMQGRRKRINQFVNRQSSFDILLFYFKKTSSILIRYRKQAKQLKHNILFCCFAVLFFSSLAGAEQTCKDSIIPTANETSFILNSDGTVSDRTTGLMWMRCSLGQEWKGKTCNGTAVILPWAEALTTAAGYEFAGYNDWRLPNKNELESIVEGRCFSPSIHEEVFPATPPAYFWSSSPYAAVSHGAWSVDFGYGTVNASIKSGSIHIRLVRDEE